MHADISNQVFIDVYTLLAGFIFLWKLNVATKLVRYLLNLKIWIWLTRVFANICKSIIVLKLIFSYQVIVWSSRFVIHHLLINFTLLFIISKLKWISTITSLINKFYISLSVKVTHIYIRLTLHEICSQSHLSILIISNDVI